MARINQPCNLTDEEAARALAEFEYGLALEEEIALMDVFPRYLFFDTNGDPSHRYCFCGWCGGFDAWKRQDEYFFQLRHGDFTECPACGYDVTLINLGRIRSGATLAQAQRVTICRKGEDGALLLISGIARRFREFYPWDLNPPIELEETMRTWLKPGKRMQWKTAYEYDNKYLGRKLGWVQKTTVTEPFNPNLKCATDGSYCMVRTDEIYETDLKYCQADDFFQETQGVYDYPQLYPLRYGVKYLATYTAYPYMEMAVKMGMYGAVADLVERGKKNADILNWSAKTPAGLLRMGKVDARAFLTAGGDLDYLRSYRSARAAGECRDMADYIGITRITGGAQNAELLRSVLELAGCTLREAVRYLSKHLSGPPDVIIRLWRDYLRMAKDLEYDLSRRDVSMPKNLVERHDAAAATLKHIKQERQAAAYAARYKQLQNLYKFSWGGMSIVIPASAEAIVAEGKALHHCVGGYAPRHMEGKVDILFLRKEEARDTSLITIEMTPRRYASDKVHMVQIHGYRNELYKGAVSPKKEYAEFLEIWLDWLRFGSKRDRAGNPILPKRKEMSA